MIRRILFLSIITGFYSGASAQNNAIKKDSFLDTLLVYKKEISNELQAKSLYRIQIYSGSKEEATDALKRFRSYFGNTSSEVIFETPNYKVRIGNYPTRLEADRELLIYKRRFRGAFIF